MEFPWHCLNPFEVAFSTDGGNIKPNKKTKNAATSVCFTHMIIGLPFAFFSVGLSMQTKDDKKYASEPVWPSGKALSW